MIILNLLISLTVFFPSTTSLPLVAVDSQVAEQVHNSPAAFNSTHSASPHGPSLLTLYQGNQEFRSSRRLGLRAPSQESPSFMLIGCLDNGSSPDDIFSAPSNSIMSHNNIGNQYSSGDPSAKAAVTYAVESMHVQHIIVLGHYNCSCTQDAISPPSSLSPALKNWIQPVINLYSKSRRAEIVRLRDSRKPHRGLPEGILNPPPMGDAGLRALVEENVKQSVSQLRQNDALVKAYQSSHHTDNDKDVFVHGFVYDEATGEVVNLRVSFGPPGKRIPTVPFKAVARAANIDFASGQPGVPTGKKWDFTKQHTHLP